MAFVIIHADSRVIRRMTTDAVPAVAADEIAVDIGSTRLDLAGGFRTISAQGVIAPATDAEIDAAGVDPVRVEARRLVRRQAYRAALEAMATATTAADALAAIRAFGLAAQRLAD